MPEPIMKALATITDPDSATDAPNGGFTAVLSTPSIDRDGDELARDEWVEPLPDRITLDVDHEMSVQGTIGSARPYFDDAGRLMIDAAFASTPKAQEVRSLIREGHVNSVSVAFMTDRSKKDGTPRRELLNAGVVAIPSNRDAVILSAKEFASLRQEIEVNDPTANVAAAVEHMGRYAAKAGARNSQADSKMIQAIHDAASLLGAACISEAAPASGDGADEGANKAVRQTIVVGKGLTGSVEDLRDRLSDALQDVVGDGGWVWVRATFLDAGGRSGTVVYDLGDETYSRTFTDEDGLITLGTSIECVTIVTAVKPADPQVDDDPSDAVVGAADEHDPDEKSHPKDIAAFAAALDALTKSSGDNAGSPDSSAEAPAEPPADAAPQGPADAAGEAADKAAEEMAQKMAAEMLAGTFSAQVTLSTLEP